MSSHGSYSRCVAISWKYAQDTRDVITQRNRLESPLLCLPAELRNTIYKYAFGPHDLYVDKIEYCSLVTFLEDAPPLTVRETLQLLETCRQIRSETKLLYWQSKVFRFGPPCFHDSSIRNWLNALAAEQRNAIRHIAVHKDEVKQEALWEQLPRLRELRRITFWGSYFLLGSDPVLDEGLTQINGQVNALMGHHVEVEMDVEG